MFIIFLDTWCHSVTLRGVVILTRTYNEILYSHDYKYDFSVKIGLDCQLPPLKSSKGQMLLDRYRYGCNTHRGY